MRILLRYRIVVLLLGATLCGALLLAFGARWGNDEMGPAVWQVRGAALALAFSPDGKTLAVAEGVSGNSTYSVTIHLRAVPDGKVIRTLTEVSGNVSAIMFSPDGQVLAAGVGDKLHVWQTRDGSLRYTIPLNEASGSGYGVMQLAWSPDGSSIFATVGGSLRVWQSDDGKELPPIVPTGGEIIAIAFSITTDSILVAGWQDSNNFTIWRASDGQVIMQVDRKGYGEPQLSSASGLVLSRDGQVLAAIAGSGIGVWSIENGTQRASLRGHTDNINSLAFSPIDTRLASASGEEAQLAASPGDRTIRVWNTDNGEAQQVLSEHSAPIPALAWRHDGRLLASGSLDQTVRLWTLD